MCVSLMYSCSCRSVWICVCAGDAFKCGIVCVEIEALLKQVFFTLMMLSLKQLLLSSVLSSFYPFPSVSLHLSYKCFFNSFLHIWSTLSFSFHSDLKKIIKSNFSIRKSSDLLQKAFQEMHVLFANENMKILQGSLFSHDLFCVPNSHRNPQHQFWGVGPQPTVPTAASPSLQALLRLPGQVLWIPLWCQCMWGLQGRTCSSYIKWKLLPESETIDLWKWNFLQAPILNTAGSIPRSGLQTTVVPFCAFLKLHLLFSLHQMNCSIATEDVIEMRCPEGQTAASSHHQVLLLFIQLLHLVKKTNKEQKRATNEKTAKSKDKFFKCGFPWPMYSFFCIFGSRRKLSLNFLLNSVSGQKKLEERATS